MGKKKKGTLRRTEMVSRISKMRVENRLGSGIGFDGSRLVGTGKSDRVWFVSLAVIRRLLYSVRIVLTFAASAELKGSEKMSTRLWTVIVGSLDEILEAFHTSCQEECNSRLRDLDVILRCQQMILFEQEFSRHLGSDHRLPVIAQQTRP